MATKLSGCLHSLRASELEFRSSEVAQGETADHQLCSKLNVTT